MQQYKLLNTLLSNRGYSEKERKHIIYEPYNSINNPYELYNADKAANLIKAYCEDKNSEIYVFADYDVDGLTSGFILGDVLNNISQGYSTVLFPNRCDGYGLNMDTCQQIVYHKKEKDNILVITVDNGITCIEQIKYLKDNNIEVIVLDHHESKEIVPDCLIVDAHGNHKDPDYYHLCGCGVVFKVCQILLSLYNNFDTEKYTPFVALGTLADMMDLTEENIAYIRYGIDYMNSDKIKNWIGLYSIIDYCGLSGNVYPINLKFDVIPKLNACGRMNNIQLAYSLLTAESESAAEDIVNEIVDLNDKRKDLTKESVKFINAEIDKNQGLESYTNYYNNHCFSLLLDKEYSGICGVVATQAINLCNSPISFVSVQTGEDTYSGSIRIADYATSYLDAQEILNQELQNNTILFFGGHKAAAGFSVSIDNYEKFVEDVNKYIQDKQNNIYIEDTRESEIAYDTDIEIKDLNKDFYDSYAFIPFKDEPVFRLKDMYCVSSHCSKNNSLNIEYKFAKNNEFLNVWIWNQPDKNIDKKTIDIFGNVVQDFRNRKRYTLNIKDVAIDI